MPRRSSHTVTDPAAQTFAPGDAVVTPRGLRAVVVRPVRGGERVEIRYTSNPPDTPKGLRGNEYELARTAILLARLLSRPPQ